MTGKYPGRLISQIGFPVAVTSIFKAISAEKLQALPLEEVTLAEALKANGYRTGIFGKWHGNDQAGPLNQGFDVQVPNGTDVAQGVAIIRRTRWKA